MQDLIEATRRATADIRQKDPLAHRRRRRENRPHIPKDVHKDILGEDGKGLSEEDMKKANGLWKMLDDMYEADPEEYKKFIEKQMKEGREAGFKLPGQSNNSNVGNANGALSKPMPTKGSNVKTTGGSFTPNGGFVVKARKLYTGDKVFLNICSHPGVQVPLTAGGSPVDENTPGQFARQIPLLIGQPRDGLDKSNQPIIAIDCVFNPWVITAVSRDNMFKVNTVELAMQWVHQDHQIKLHKNWKIIKSKYKCGGGKIGNVPIPFPIDNAKSQSSPNNESNQEEKKKKKIDKTESVKPTMSSPSELLKQARKSNMSNEAPNDGTNSNLKMPFDVPGNNVDRSTRKKPLIQDLSEDKKDQKSSMQQNQAGATKKKKKKKKKVIKGGFLNNNKEALYPDGSNEGAPKGLLSKCKVVDTTKMSEDQLKKTMEDYAAPGGNLVKKKQPKRKAAPAKAKKQKDKERAKVNPGLEAAFDEMMEMADPDLVKSNVEKSLGNTGVAEFDALTDLLSGGASMHELNEMAKRSDLRSNFKEKGKPVVKNSSPTKSLNATNVATDTPTSPKEIKVETDGYQDLVGENDLWELE